MKECVKEETMRENIVKQLADVFSEPLDVIWYASSAYTEQGLNQVYMDTVDGREQGRLEQAFRSSIRAAYAAYAVAKRKTDLTILRVLETKRFCWPGETTPWKDQTQYFLVLSEESSGVRGMDMVSVSGFHQTRLQNCDVLLG